MKHNGLKNGLAIILMVMVVFLFSTTAFAATGQYKTTQKFIEYLESSDIKYSYEGTLSGGNECVSVSIKLDNFDSLECSLFFNEDCDMVSLRIWDIIKVSAGKNFALAAINKLNSAYKFLKFVYDESDSTVGVEVDMYITPDFCQENIGKGMLAMFFVIDQDENAKTLHSLE